MQFHWHFGQGSSRVGAMNPTTTLAITLVNERAAEVAEVSEDSLWQRCYTLCSLAAFSLYEVSELRLRSFLKIGGINLENTEEFDTASGLVSAFVLVKGLIVTGLCTPTLVDLEHDMLKTFVFDEALQGAIEDTKFQGILWRESLLDVE
jgi:hypothetical protein